MKSLLRSAESYGTHGLSTTNYIEIVNGDEG
jgi:hypothetical protein